MITVKELHNEGKIVAMVGDGINDAPALEALESSHKGQLRKGTTIHKMEVP